jgi:hypothetical protein
MQRQRSRVDRGRCQSCTSSHVLRIKFVATSSSVATVARCIRAETCLSAPALSLDQYARWVVTGHAQGFDGMRPRPGGWKMATAFCCPFDGSNRSDVATQASVEDSIAGKGTVVGYAGVDLDSLGPGVPEVHIGIAVAGDVGVGRDDVEAAHSTLVEDTHTAVILGGMRGRSAGSPHLVPQASSATSSQ